MRCLKKRLSKIVDSKNENLQKSILGQINALKSEVYVKHKAFEAEVKAEQIDIQNMQSEMSNLSEKIKDLNTVVRYHF